MNKFREARPLVEEVLKNSFSARNDDKELLIQALALAGFKWDSQNLAIFRGFYSMETLRRMRQKIQEDGMFQGAEKTKKKRSQAARETARFMKKQHIEKEWKQIYTVTDPLTGQQVAH